MREQLKRSHSKTTWLIGVVVCPLLFWSVFEFLLVLPLLLPFQSNRHNERREEKRREKIFTTPTDWHSHSILTRFLHILLMSDSTLPPSSSSNDGPTAADLAAAEEYFSEGNFLKLHKPQFMAMKLPPQLMRQVYHKLLNQQFDASENFEVQLVEGEGYRVVVSKEGGLKAGQDVFLFDHMWTTTMKEGPKQLKEIDGLVDRLWTLANMDGHLEAEREERNQAAAAATTQENASPFPAAASSAPVELDEDTLSAIMSGASVSRDRAIEAYRSNAGDLIASIVACAPESETEAAVKKQMEATLATQDPANDTAALPNGRLPDDLSTLTLEQRIPLVWEGLFKHHLVGSYFTTRKVDVSASSLTQDDVEHSLFVNDEIGSAIAMVRDPVNANAEMKTLICVTLDGVGFSLLWLTKDLAQGEEVLITQRAEIRLPGVPWPKSN